MRRGCCAQPADAALAAASFSQVKERFKDNKSVYDQFLEIMKQFKAQQYVARAQRGALAPLLQGPQRAEC